MATHLVTGATGFVGGAIVLDLLDRTDDPIIALARPPARTEDGDAHTRLISSLRHAATAYGRDPDALPLDRVRGIAGDVTRPNCGVEAAHLRADTLWHSAASLRYEDRYAEEIIATNLGGTRNVLDLAREAGVSVMNTISTAYVVGGREGHMYEVPQDDAPAQNHYERSKIAAECLARGVGDLTVRVFRPSIVVGHSKTRAATTFSGLYSFTRQMLQYRGMLDRMQAGLSRSRRIRIRAADDTPLNLVPVDAVAAQAVHIGLTPSATGIYHLTQPDPPTVGSTIRIIAEQVGFPEPEFVDGDTKLEWLDEQLDKRLDFYSGYIRAFRVFDRSRADAALGNHHPLRCALPPVEDLVSWYLTMLRDQRRNLPAAR